MSESTGDPRRPGSLGGEGTDTGEPGGEELRPVPPGQRIVTVDILRGVAILGILFVNMLWFAQPELYLQQAGMEWWTGAWNRAADTFIRLVAEGKFISMFSFLFGLGMAIQMRRAHRRGSRFTPLFIRRLAGLLVIGLVHGVLLWHGDILTSYAVLGFVLLRFRHGDLDGLLRWAVGLLLVPVVVVGLLTALMALASVTPEGAQQMEAGVAEQREMFVGLVDASVEAYREGSYGEALERRVGDFAFIWAHFIFWLPPVLALFLVGLYAGRREIFRKAEAHLGLVRKVTVWGLLLGGVANLLYAAGMHLGVRSMDGTWTGFAVGTLHTLGAPVLSLGYMGGITLLCRRAWWQERLGPLAAVGRMALTNYLAQTVICTAIFYGYGLGLYGQVGPAPGLALTLTIFLLQLAWSPWWLNRFRYGPVEWAWRSATYGRLQPLRLRDDGSEGQG